MFESNPDKNYKKGKEALTKSFLCCKFTPNYTGGIIYLKKAADEYHGAKKYKEEINARTELAKCFKNEKYFYEEGSEHEKIATLKLNQLNDPQEGYESIINAFSSYIEAKEYEYAFKALLKYSIGCNDTQNYEISEKVLDFFYDNILKFFHMLAYKKDSTSLTVAYDGIETYINSLIKNNKDKQVFKVIDSVLNLIDSEDKNNKKMRNKFLMIKLGMFILTNDDNGFNKCEQKECDSSCATDLATIKDVKKAMESCNEREFKLCIVDCEYLLPNYLTNRLHLKYKNLCSSHNKNSGGNDYNNNINREGNNYLDIPEHEDFK